MASKEVTALTKYLDDSGVPHVITATTGTYVSAKDPCHPHAPGSYHCRTGTNGVGLALDVAVSWGGPPDSPGLLAIRNTISRADAISAEVIYAGPGHPPCIKNGRAFTYDAKTMAGHHNHVHWAVERGVFPLWVPTTTEASHMINKPACVVLLTPSEQGYYIIAEDGGVFSYGDGLDGSQFSTASVHHNAKIVDAKLSKSGHGMIQLAADGGIDTRGDIPFKGSAAG